MLPRILWLSLAACLAATARAMTYEVAELGVYVPSQHEYGNLGNFAVNADGDVAGTAFTGGDSYQAFIYREGAVQLLGTLGGSQSAGTAINRRGDVVGGSTKAHVVGTHAFLWNGQRMKDLGLLPGGTTSVAKGVNQHGQVTGYASADYGTGHIAQRAFLYDNGAMIDLGTLGGTYSQATAINKWGQVTGCADLAHGGARAFLYDAGVMRDLGSLGGTWSCGRALNDAGDVVGNSDLPTLFEPPHAVLFKDGAVIDLGTLGGGYSVAAGINAHGDIVGWSTTRKDDIPRRPTGLKAFLYRHGRMAPLNHMLDPVSGAGWKLHQATGINDRGQIVGWGERDGKYRIFLLTPIEP